MSACTNRVEVIDLSARGAGDRVGKIPGTVPGGARRVLWPPATGLATVVDLLSRDGR